MPAHGGKKDRKWNHVRHHKGRVGRHNYYRNHFIRDKNKQRKLENHLRRWPQDECAAEAFQKLTGKVYRQPA